MKAVTDGSASYAVLEKKAKLYDKLIRGELSDEEEKEKYCVNFFGKRLEQDELQQIHHPNLGADAPPECEGGDKDGFMFNLKPMGLGRTAATMDNNEHKRFVR